MTKQHVMVDLETLGNRSNSVIISIGAVAFDLDKSETFTDTFYSVVEAQSCVDAGLQMDASTVLWWMKQSDQARKAFEAIGSPIYDTLLGFANWYPKGAKFWGNGATFDNVILSNAYAACKMKKPWGYADDRCYRTVKTLYPDVKAERVGTYHNAVDDAVTQAKHLVAILNIFPDLTAFASAVMSSEELTGVNSDRVGRIQSMYHN